MSVELLKAIQSRGGWLRVPSRFFYDYGRCSFHPCDGVAAVETNDASYSGALYHLCARHAQVVGRRRRDALDVPRVWRWLTTTVS